MCEIPLAVSNPETIVRALRQCHVKRKGELKDMAFRPPAGTDEVSVMRHTFMKSDSCKRKAKEIAAGDLKNPYVGLAAVLVQVVRDCGSDVTDSREDNFCGHAHISHGFIVPAEEPPDAELSLRLGRRARELRERAILLVDPYPTADTWTGGQVEIETQT